MGRQDNTGRTIGEALALMQRGAGSDALALLNEACRVQPGNVDLMVHQALALRVLGRLPEALRQLDATLAIDPYFFIALMSKGALLEMMGEPRRAVQIYRDALRIAPNPADTPPALETPIRRAREIVAEDSRALAAHLRERLGTLRSAHASQSLARFDECLDIYAGTKRVYDATPVQLYVPRLPAVPFFEREQFPWLVAARSGHLDDSGGTANAARCRNARICAIHRLSARHAGQPVG